MGTRSSLNVEVHRDEDGFNSAVQAGGIEVSDQ
jgi:hypothetical protein